MLTICPLLQQNFIVKPFYTEHVILYTYGIKKMHLFVLFFIQTTLL